jgi:cold shock CspA family protein
VVSGFDGSEGYVSLLAEDGQQVFVHPRDLRGQAGPQALQVSHPR